jgi:hypothetical protein
MKTLILGAALLVAVTACNSSGGYFDDIVTRVDHALIVRAVPRRGSPGMFMLQPVDNSTPPIAYNATAGGIVNADPARQYVVLTDYYQDIKEIYPYHVSNGLLLLGPGAPGSLMLYRSGTREQYRAETARGVSVNDFVYTLHRKMENRYDKPKGWF